MKENTLTSVPARPFRTSTQRPWFCNSLIQRAWFASLLAAILLAAGSLIAAQVPLPFYDAFDYAEGNLNAVASPNWIVGNGSTTFEIAVSNTASLTAPPGYPA